jgi:hypothetical protein
MRVLRLPAKTGGEVWVVVHGLTLDEGRLHNLRPIHVFTFLGQHLVRNKRRMFDFCRALENKLFGVNYHLNQLRRAISSVGEIIYSRTYVRDYESDQELICVLEAYLEAIYSTLEIISRINRILRPGLPQEFRKQSRKFPMFNFKNNAPWLARFYDIRSELCHFGTTLPIVQQGKLIIEFTNPKQLEHFSAGKHEISLKEFFGYATSLFILLDKYALNELAKIDPESDIDSIHETGLKTPLKTSKIKAKEILNLIKLKE